MDLKESVHDAKDRDTSMCGRFHVRSNRYSSWVTQRHAGRKAHGQTRKTDGEEKVLELECLSAAFNKSSHCAFAVGTCKQRAGAQGATGPHACLPCGERKRARGRVTAPICPPPVCSAAPTAAIESGQRSVNAGITEQNTTHQNDFSIY